ncbi:MAG TPA: hypothetical protein VHP14_22620 [Anaerolineales bacterium]|nr:hypothetical protein [Anaerolineales bacterium]
MTYFTILSVILLATVTVINICGVNTGEETKFVQVPVLAQGQADYGVDENTGTIPAVSPKIIEDKVHDMTSVSETVRTIEYTTLPVKILPPADKGDDDSQSTDNPEPAEDPNSDTNSVATQDQTADQSNNGNGNSNQNKDKDKDKDKDKKNNDKKDSSKVNDKKDDPAKIK